MYVEVEKEIFKYFAYNWTTTPIKWPRQRQAPDAASWVTIHVMREGKQKTRLADERADGLVNIGVFSTAENAYAGKQIIQALKAIFERRNLESSNYMIRFQEFEINNLPDTSENMKDIEVTISHHAVTLPFYTELRR